ncbi:hypothetical protein CANINC_003229 [Pichia inconspicua]|uniref:RGS domain-containing protein n=1 Tax=Pichia inconspicua TaxID=52247 RepID=A0A4T0WZD2_9ASCO|nr:hypothetical protein CANINC_003229 [[Candida] inconspicua]
MTTTDSSNDDNSKLNNQVTLRSLNRTPSGHIKSNFALELLNMFYGAKLLHCPDDKTCKKITTVKTVLQPTPKGVSMLHQFCLKMGISNIKDLKIPPILNSSFNSMKLMEFERHSRTDQLIHNTQSDKILFVLIMGPKMNIWSSMNEPDSISNYGSSLSLRSKLNKSNIYAAGNQMQSTLEDSNAFLAYLRQRQAESPGNDTDEDEDILRSSDSVKTEKVIVSPFHHRFFTNPDSDSHVQYYVSNKGLRFFTSKTVRRDNKDQTVKNCFSGKALTQYLMDCTDLMYIRDAIKIANVFLEENWIEFQSIPSQTFLPTKDAIYTLTDAGMKLVKWNNSNTLDLADVTDENLGENISFNKTLRDPALKYLFRNFLIDNMCVENLDVFDDIVDFQKKMKILKKMVSLKDREKKKYIEEIQHDSIFDELKSNQLQHKKLTIYTAINKLLEFCLSKIYSIFAMYVSEDAPNEVNIDSKLRFQVQNYVQKKVRFDSTVLNVSDLKKRCLETTEFNGKLITINSDPATETEKKENVSSNLTLNLKHLREAENPPLSPTDVIFGPKLKFLDDVCTFYEEIKRKVYRMMEVDSFEKFLNSEELKRNYIF